MAITIATQIARGLEAIHEQGIVHRDLKPANVMLLQAQARRPLPPRGPISEPWKVKIIDFGLARAFVDEGLGDPAMTQTVGFRGTALYASPEQCAERRDLDGRSDIYSLGCIIFEMLSGHPPFIARTHGELMSQHLTRDPPLERLAQLPTSVVAVVARMLIKDPGHRFPNARALIKALEGCQHRIASGESLAGEEGHTAMLHDATMPPAGSETPRPPTFPRVRRTVLIAAIALLGLCLATWFALRTRSATQVSSYPSASSGSAQGPAMTAPEKSIAVLPFENRSSEKDNEYFADGMQDEILTNLARIADLKVISRSSVMQYKSGVPRNLREIAPALGVTYILEGSVQRSEGKVRVTAQLIDARTDRDVWAERYDRNLADVFSIQSEIAERIAAQLKARLSDSEKAAITERPTGDLVAFELYLRARQIAGDWVTVSGFMDENERAIGLLDEAVARDPNFLAAWTLLERLHDTTYWFGYDRTATRLALAQNAVNQAVKLRPDAGETQLAQAQHFYHGYRDYDRAMQHLAVARTVLPNSWEIPYLTGAIERRQGNWEASSRILEQALEFNPLNFSVLHDLTRTYSLQRRYDDALRIASRIDRLDPKDPYVRLWTPMIDLERDANPVPLRARIDAQMVKNPQAAASLALTFALLCLEQRDLTAASRAVAMLRPDNNPGSANERYPRAYFSALVAGLANQPALAREQFDAARLEAATLVSAQPDDAKALAVLALIDAGLGQKDLAMREARRACDMLPISRDTYDGPYLKRFLALVAAQTGENDIALSELESLARIPSPVNYGDLQLNPLWDALREEPRFTALLAELAPPAGSSNRPLER